MMKALVYGGPGQKSWEQVPLPRLQDQEDAIVRVDAVTICGTDLHILKGDVPEVESGRILGHEAVGTVLEIGDGVRQVAVGVHGGMRLGRARDRSANLDAGRDARRPEPVGS